jgi:hypothetical protein
MENILANFGDGNEPIRKMLFVWTISQKFSNCADKTIVRNGAELRSRKARNLASQHKVSLNLSYSYLSPFQDIQLGILIDRAFIS